MSNYRRGEAHHRAKCSDNDVILAIELVERYGLSLREVGDKFDVSRKTVWEWVSGRRRGNSVSEVG